MRILAPLALALVTLALAGCGGDLIVEPVTTEETIPPTVPQATGRADALTCLEGNGADVDPYDPGDDTRDADWYTVTLPDNSAIIALHTTRPAAREHADELGDESIGYAYVSWNDSPSAAESNLFASCLDYD